MKALALSETKGFMPEKEKIILCWSGGKDSALTLYELKKSEMYEVVALVTTVTEGYERISMHGVRNILLDRQAKLLNIPVDKVFISQGASNLEYESKMEGMLTKYQAMGVSTVAFGDIFLEDLRRYRETNLARIGMEGLFPIWKRSTQELADSFINLGFKAVVVCVDKTYLDETFSGRIFDHSFLSNLPSNVDPCGENGEFHSFVYDGPLFEECINYLKGEVVLRDNRFYYCDLVPCEINGIQVL